MELKPRRRKSEPADVCEGRKERIADGKALIAQKREKGKKLKTQTKTTKHDWLRSKRNDE